MKKAYTNEQRQQEQLLSLGEMLRQARQAQGRSLSEIAQLTLIRQPLLAAIESADLEELPEPVYVRGLIRRYAETLGLDGETLSSQYFEKPATAERPGFWHGASAQSQLRPFHLYGAYVLLIAVSVSGLSFVLKQTAPDTAAPPILDPKAIEQLMPKQQPQVKPTLATAEPKAVASNEPIVVEVEFIQQSWIRVVADGKTEFEGILQQGDSRAWTADNLLTIRAGNAGGVLVAYNQGKAAQMGQPGMVAEKSFQPGETISMGLEASSSH